jgi:5-methylcytosine-specific restriction endonuclease McrA
MPITDRRAPTNQRYRNSYKATWHRQQRAARRQALIAEMGGACVLCGATEDLEFDHWPAPAPCDHSRYNSTHRLAHYRNCWKTGGLRLLCRNCNAAQGNPDGKLF